MFSGLTNQFSSLVGAVKGGQADEDVPAPNADATTTAAAAAAATAGADASVAAEQNAAEQLGEGEEGAKSPLTLVDSIITEASGWLGSAKGWLGSASIPSMPAMPSMAIPSMPAMPSMPSIPGLRKGGAEAGEASAEGGAEQADVTGGGVSGEDDDKSRYISATEGADSHPASGGGTPTGEEGQIGQGKGEDVKITTKVTQQAKHFGSFLSSAINKAGAKIKETVKDNNILDSFNKEQEAFIKGQSGGADSGVAPWIGHNNEGKIKEEILGLSQDRRNFVRAPPAGVDFEFNYESSYPTAIAIINEDKALETMRFELVPKIITEENFWRNYFYRVSLIIQAAELGTLGADGVGQASSGEDVNILNKQNEKSIAQNLRNISDDNNENNQKQTEQENANAKINTTTTKTATESEQKTAATATAATTVNANATNAKSSNTKKSRKNKTISESEFVSDAFPSAAETETDLAEIKDGMRKLGIDSMTQQMLSNDEEQWEKDLEAELKDYEVVCDPTKTSSGGIGKRGASQSNTSVTNTTADDNDDELPTISNIRTRSTNNDWEEYADLIEDTDDLKTLKSLKRAMLGYE